MEWTKGLSHWLLPLATGFDIIISSYWEELSTFRVHSIAVHYSTRTQIVQASYSSHLDSKLVWRSQDLNVNESWFSSQLFSQRLENNQRTGVRNGIGLLYTEHPTFRRPSGDKLGLLNLEMLTAAPPEWAYKIIHSGGGGDYQTAWDKMARWNEIQVAETFVDSVLHQNTGEI